MRIPRFGRLTITLPRKLTVGRNYWNKHFPHSTVSCMSLRSKIFTASASPYARQNTEYLHTAHNIQDKCTPRQEKNWRLIKDVNHASYRKIVISLAELLFTHTITYRNRLFEKILPICPVMRFDRLIRWYNLHDTSTSSSPARLKFTEFGC